MTASSLQVTPGSGLRLATNSYTEGGNTVHDEKVILGEQYLASYIANTVSTATATANSHLIQIMAGASLNVYVRRIEMYQNAMATTAANMSLQIFRLTTAGTGGTVVAANPLDTTDAATGAAPMTLPTVKGTEGVTVYSGSAYLMQTVAVSSQLSEPIFVVDFDRLRTKGLRIPAGTANGICLKNPNTGYAGATVLINIWYSEASF